jgi:hypothetical protein
MDARSAFKLGFLTHCLANGLDVRQTAQLAKQASEALRSGRIKQAGFGVDDAIKATGDVAGKVVDAATPVAVAGGLAALAAPPIVGAIGGYGLGRMSDLDENDADDVSKATVLHELRRQTDYLNRLRRMRARMGQS